MLGRRTKGLKSGFVMNVELRVIHVLAVDGRCEAHVQEFLMLEITFGPTLLEHFAPPQVRVSA